MHDQPQDRVVDRAVLVLLADRRRQLDGPQLANRPFERSVTRVAVALERPPGLGRQAARLIQQVADGDYTGSVLVGDAEPGQVALYRRVELDLPRLDELHDRHGGERLAQRADDERRPRRHRPTRVVGLTEAAHVGDPVVPDDAQRESGNSLHLHLVLDEAFDRGVLAGGGLAVGGRSVRARPGRPVGRTEDERGKDRPAGDLPLTCAQ